MTNGAVALYTIIALFFLMMLSIAFILMSIVTQLKEIAIQFRVQPTTTISNTLKSIRRELEDHNNYIKGNEQR